MTSGCGGSQHTALLVGVCVAADSARGLVTREAGLLMVTLRRPVVVECPERVADGRVVRVGVFDVPTGLREYAWTLLGGAPGPAAADWWAVGVFYPRGVTRTLVARCTRSDGMQYGCVVDVVYVHATVRGFHPNNRYRVVDAVTVAEPGWSGGSGLWGLVEGERQVCPVPIGERCACVVVQRECGGSVV